MATMQFIVCFLTALGSDCVTATLPDPMEANVCQQAAPIAAEYVERRYRMEYGYTGGIVVTATCLDEISQ